MFISLDPLSESKCFLMVSALERYSATSDRIKDLDCSLSSSVLACYERRRDNTYKRRQTSLCKHEVIHALHVLLIRLCVVLRSIRIDRLFRALERFLNKFITSVSYLEFGCCASHGHTCRTDIEDDRLRRSVALTKAINVRCHTRIRLLVRVNIDALPDGLCSVQVFICFRF